MSVDAFDALDAPHRKVKPVKPLRVGMNLLDDGTVLEIEHEGWPVEITDDWSELLIFLGIKPEHVHLWEVTPGTVAVSRWQIGKGSPEGDIAKEWLWSYKAKFNLITPDDEVQLALDADLAEAVSSVRKWKPSKTPSKASGEPVTYVHLQGDEQAGKSQGGSLQGLFERESEVVQNSVEVLREYLKRGVNIEAIADLSAGDRIENIYGHYNSQSRTTATLREQQKFARGMDIMRTQAFADFGIPIKKVYTPSNHGEIRQSVGQAPHTSESDNYDLMIAEQVQEVLSQTDIGGLLEWHIPHDQWWTLLTLSGVKVGLTHGHKCKSAAQLATWVKGQRSYIDDVMKPGHKISLAFMGHLHHLRVEDLGGVTVIQSPTIDGGSPYFEASSGTWSHHGALSVLVGDSFRPGWNSLRIL